MNKADGSRRAQVASLAGARMPADHGLTSLGMLMRLAGTIFLVVYAYLAIAPLLVGGGGATSDTWWWFLFAATSAFRSAFHRSAGQALIQGAPGGPLGPTRIYIGVSIVHTVIAAIAIHKLFAPMAEFDDSFQAPIVPLVAACLAWPAALAVLVTRPRFKQLTDRELPRAEDLGYEGIAVLMSLMGAAGIGLAALMLLAVVKAAGSPVADGAVFFTCLILVLLMLRSFLHVKAGAVGTGGADAHTFHDRAQSYYNFGVASALLAGGGLLVIIFMYGFHPRAFLPIGMMVYLLLVWPLMLKDFFSERNYEVLMAGDGAPVLRRAPDRGLTALGWLLIATSVTALATEVASLVSSPSGGNEMLLIVLQLSGDAPPQGLDRWLALGSTALQLWAGIELVTMSERHHLAANVFGVFGTVATIAMHWDIFESFDALGRAVGRTGANPFGSSIEVLLPIVVALVLPIGALLLANRKNVASARVVQRPQTDR